MDKTEGKKRVEGIREKHRKNIGKHFCPNPDGCDWCFVLSHITALEGEKPSYIYVEHLSAEDTDAEFVGVGKNPCPDCGGSREVDCDCKTYPFEHTKVCETCKDGTELVELRELKAALVERLPTIKMMLGEENLKRIIEALK